MKKIKILAVAAALIAALAAGLAACGGAPSPAPASKPAAPVLHLSGADQGIICAGINAMVFTGTSNPFATETAATSGKFQVSTVEAAPAVALAIRDRCPKFASVIPAGH